MHIAKSKKIPFKPYEGSKEDDQHIRLTKDMLMHENYINLSVYAKSLYNYIKMWVGSQYDFDYSIGTAMKVCNFSKPMVIKVKKELIDKGFIDLVQDNKYRRIKNVYRFSKKWTEK